MINRALFVLAPLALAAAGALCVEAPLPDPAASGTEPGKRLEVLMERVKLAQQDLRTLEAEFTQRRESAMFAAPELARGVFSYAAPDQVRWEYAGPKQMTLVIRGKIMTTWYRDLGRADRLNIGRYQSQVLRYLGAGGSLETLLQYFAVRLAVSTDLAEPFRLDLDPRFARVAKRMKAMSIWIDRKTFLPVRLRYQEPDGDTTEYRFEKVKVNGPLPPERFELNLPKSVTIHTIDLEHGAKPES